MYITHNMYIYIFGLLSILYVFQVKCECDSLRGAECSYFATESDGCTPVDRNAFPLCIQPYMYSIIVTTKTIEISWKPENCGGYITYNISVSCLLWVPFFSSTDGTQKTLGARHRGHGLLAIGCHGLVLQFSMVVLIRKSPWKIAPKILG